MNVGIYSFQSYISTCCFSFRKYVKKTSSQHTLDALARAMYLFAINIMQYKQKSVSFYFQMRRLTPYVCVCVSFDVMWWDCPFIFGISSIELSV